MPERKLTINLSQDEWCHWCGARRRQPTVYALLDLPANAEHPRPGQLYRCIRLCEWCVRRIAAGVTEKRPAAAP